MLNNNHNLRPLPPKRLNDVGLQPQRTVLSWFRTAAVVFVNALLLIRVGSHTSNLGYVIIGIMLLLLATAIYAYSLIRNQKVNYDVELVDQTTVRFHAFIVIILSIVAGLLAVSILYHFVYS